MNTSNDNQTSTFNLHKLSLDYVVFNVSSEDIRVHDYNYKT